MTTAYLRWTFTRAALARGWWLTTAVYLVTVADLSPAELVLVGVFQGLAVVLAEVPAGLLADTISRRLALVVAHVVMGTGMALTGFVTHYPLVVVSQCLWGLGWAISSGADVAWITDELDRPDVIDRVLTAQGRFDLLGGPTGIVAFGVLGWASDLSTAIVAGGAGMIGLGAVVVARWPESHRPGPSAGRWAATVGILRQGVRTARRDRVMALALLATLLVNGGAEGFGRLFERHVLDLGLPTATDPIVWFAAIGVLAAVVGSITLHWVEARIEGRRVVTVTYVAACATAALGLVLFAYAPDIESAMAATLLVKGTGLPVVRVAATILVNRRTTDRIRATVHSLLSQAENLGEILFGLVLAGVAATWSPTRTLVAAACLVTAAGIAVGSASDPDGHETRTHRRWRRADVTSPGAKAPDRSGLGGSRPPPATMRCPSVPAGAAGSCATARREPSQGRKAAALSGPCGVPQSTWPPPAGTGPRPDPLPSSSPPGPGTSVGSIAAMAHQSLYRRYRPQRFSEVRGQSAVTEALRAAVADERVGHAYMFSGPRGTGKTSTARILAKALNCEDLREGEPCGACASCVAMQEGSSYDLQELDAASNNKVEDVRSLIERVALGSPGRTKVYILDEVHMLSPGASNALLKTLEEPPDHVVFVLATTDPQKVLPTIRSRTQHFEFHLLPADELSDHVRWVIDDAGLDVDDDAVEHVLRAGGGSARDTLSFLDQAAAGGVSATGDHAEALAAAVVAVDTAAALTAVAEATVAGRDPRVLGEALLGHLRDVFLHRMGGPLDHLSDAARERVAGWAGDVTDRGVTRALEEVGEALLAMRQAPDPRIPLEVALMRITRPSTGDGAGDDMADLVARVERLERGVAAGGPAPVRDDGSHPTDPAAPPPSRGSAGAAGPGISGREAARAAVASSRGGSGPARSAAAPEPPPPSQDPVSPPPPDPEPSPPDPSPTPGAAAPGVGEAPPASEPPAGAAARPVAPTADLAGLWADEALPAMRGMAKALFKLGRVVSVEDDTLTIGLPNRTHVDRCEEKRGEAEEALSRALGRPARLVLVVGGDDEGGGRGDEGGRPSSGGAGDRSVGEDPVDEAIDPEELVDAPDNRLSGVDRITDAFPGAQIVES